MKSRNAIVKNDTTAPSASASNTPSKHFSIASARFLQRAGAKIRVEAFLGGRWIQIIPDTDAGRLRYQCPDFQYRYSLEN